jgi:sepiapterin reductase
LFGRSVSFCRLQGMASRLRAAHFGRLVLHPYDSLVCHKHLTESTSGLKVAIRHFGCIIQLERRRLDGSYRVRFQRRMATTTNNTTPTSHHSPPKPSWAFLITGASRGLGQAIAIVANENLSSKCSSLHFVLVARSLAGLQVTKESILQISEASLPSSAAVTTMSGTSPSKPTVSVVCHDVDLSNLDELDNKLDVILNDLQVDRFDRIVFINNAGSLGHLGPCITSPSLQDMRQTVDFNITSCLWSSVRFARHIQEGYTHNSNDYTRMGVIVDATIVNISSLVAISDDFVTMGIYSSGKAAREKYHILLAAEVEKATKQQQSDATSSNNRVLTSDSGSCVRLKTLNYAPGPIETEMTEEIRNSVEFDVDLSKNFQTQLLDAKDSARKLISLLDENVVQSGSHMDYYDLPNA